MTKLVILRHGNTFDKGDEVLRIGARTDLLLSTSGKEQAQKIAIALNGSFGPFERVFSSPLLRAKATATYVASNQEPLPHIECSDHLTEIDYGPDEGKPERLVIDRLGEKVLRAWEEDATPPSGWLVDPPALIASWRHFYAEIADNTGPVLAVTSNGVARFALAAADQCDGVFPQKLKTAAYGVVDIDASGRSCVAAWNLSE